MLLWRRRQPWSHCYLSSLLLGLSLYFPSLRLLCYLPASWINVCISQNTEPTNVVMTLNVAQRVINTAQYDSLSVFCSNHVFILHWRDYHIVTKLMTFWHRSRTDRNATEHSVLCNNVNRQSALQKARKQSVSYLCCVSFFVLAWD